MYNMTYDITIGSYRLGMVHKVEVHRSVELLADTATITLPAAQFGRTLNVEDRLQRGDQVTIRFGYVETGIRNEFQGWLQRIATDGGSITLYCEDDLFLFRRPIPNRVLQSVTLDALLRQVIADAGLSFSVQCSYQWTYSRFVISNASAYDVLRKVQEECGADIYIADSTLHIHPPGEFLGSTVYYDIQRNVERTDLIYHEAADKPLCIVVKANMPDGTVREIEVGTTGGERLEIKCPTSDIPSMQLRGEMELRRRCFDGYEGSLTTWLQPSVAPACAASIHDADYPYKDGTYFVTAVTTEFSASGGIRTVQLGFRLS
jgi:hypothetical protein